MARRLALAAALRGPFRPRRRGPRPCPPPCRLLPRPCRRLLAAFAASFASRAAWRSARCFRISIHRGALVVEAELPGPPAEALDRQARRLARRSSTAPRGARGHSRGRAAGRRRDRSRRPRGRRGSSPRSRQPLAALEVDDPQAVGLPSSCARPSCSQTLHGPRILSSSMPAQMTLARSSLLGVDLGRGLVQHLAGVADDALLGHLAVGDLVHLRLELGGHLRRGHRSDELLERLIIAIPVSDGIGGLP